METRDPKVFKKAFDLVKKGNNSIREAARACGIPYATLHRRLSAGDSLINPVGCPKYLSEVEESQLVQWIKNEAASG